jgi:hypothetical protein
MSQKIDNSTNSVPVIRPDYTSTAVELQFELLKQFAWLSSTIIGAIVVLLQLDQVTLGKHVYTALSCFAISVVISVQGQDYLVSKLAEGKVLEDLASRMKRIRITAFGLICFGVGIMVSHFWKQ